MSRAIVAVCAITAVVGVAMVAPKIVGGNLGAWIFGVSESITAKSEIMRFSGVSQAFMTAMNSLAQAAPAALDKNSIMHAETSQSSFNYDAAADIVDRSVGSSTIYDSESPNACSTTINRVEATNAMADSDVSTKAITVYKTRLATDALNSSAEMAQMVKNHNEKYCSKDAEDHGRCTRSYNGELQDADINAATLFGSETGDTMSFEEHEAALKYIDMATNPVPSEALPKSVEDTPAGQRYLLEQRIAAANASTAKYALAKVAAQRSAKNTETK